MKLKRQSNCIYRCEYHLILVTKYRKKIFNNGIHAYMVARLQELSKNYPELEIIKINHDEDHIHILISIPPKMSVGRVVAIIKSNTARRLKEKFGFLKEAYWGTESIWSGGYFVSTVGLNETVIKNYIEMQGKEDAGQAKLEL